MQISRFDYFVDFKLNLKTAKFSMFFVEIFIKEIYEKFIHFAIPFIHSIIHSENIFSVGGHNV